MVKFEALQSAKVTDSKAPKPHNDALNDALEQNLIDYLKENPDTMQVALAATFGVSRPTIQRMMKSLIDSGKIQRVGGKRYGHWIVL